MENLSNNINEGRILFTGGSGRLGMACKKIFPKAQYPKKEELNILKPKIIENYLSSKNIDVIVHLAAMANIPACEENRDLAYKINVQGTINILEAAKNNYISHFVYLNTACVFPGTNDERMEDEDSLPYPKHYYGLTKYIAEEVAKIYNSPDMLVTIVRTNFTSMPWEYPRAFTDRFGTYLFAQGVAKGLKDIIQEKPNHPIIHIAGDKKISMYDYATAGKSNVLPMTINDYKGVSLTKNMSITSKYWKLYRLEDSDFNDNK